MPLVLASLYSIVALYFVNRVLVEETIKGISDPTLMIFSFAMIFSLYILYFVATYWQYKRVLQVNR